MHPYISFVKLFEFGLFEEVNLKLSPDVNIIIGANASGKTTLLKGICFCFAHNFKYLRLGDDAEFFSTVKFENEEIVIGAAKIKSRSQIGQNINIQSWGLPEMPSNIKVFQTGADIPFNILVIGANRNIRYKKIEGMRAESKGQGARNQYKASNLESLESSNLPEIKQWMINRYFIIEKDWAAVEKKNWFKIIESLPLISPINAQMEFIKIERDLEPVFKIHNSECYLEELSSGFKSFLAIVFSIVQWVEEINEGESALMDNAMGSVLIDEIDAHLHPSWQANVIKSLKYLFPKLQFIITTHSPLVISSAETNQIIKIPEHDGVLRLEPENKNYTGWQFDYILEDLMGTLRFNEMTSDILIPIDKAYNQNNIELFDEELKKLSNFFNPKDPIIQIYKFKRSNIFLKD